MKVAIIYPSPAPYRERLFSKLSTLKGIDLTVYFCSSSSYNDLIFHSEKYNKEFLKELFPNLKFNPEIILKLVKNRPDIIIIWGWGFPTAIISLFTAFILNTTTILFSDTGIPYRSFSHFTTFILNNIKKMIIFLPKSFICQGKLSQKYLLQLGAQDNQIKILPINCIDTLNWWNKAHEARINKKVIRKKYNINFNDKIILFLGMLEQRKNCEMLLEAFSILKDKLIDIYLLIIGDGPQRSYLESKCLRYNLSKVIFLGSRPYEELPEFCGISDCLVLPTLADHWPLVLIEGLASGLPIITTDRCGSAPELINNKGVVRIVNSHNIEELSEAIYDFITLKEPELKQLRNVAFELSKKYDYRLAARLLSKFLHTQTA